MNFSGPSGVIQGVLLSDTAPPVRRLVLVAGVWLAATAFGLAVAAVTKAGPIVARLSPNHGIHLGDLAAFSVAYMVALLVTVVVLSRR